MQQSESRKVSKTYEISNTSTLVDLNQDITNFAAEFKVYPKDKSKVYKIAVVDQTHIDNSEIDYKDVTGDMGATVSWDKGVYKNHYIALKSLEPVEINVEIELKEIPKIEQPAAPVQSPSLRNSSQKPYRNREHRVRFQEGDQLSEQEEETQQASSKFKNIWFKISIICLSIIGAILLWKFFSKSKKNQQTDTVYTPQNPLITTPQSGGDSDYQSNLGLRPRSPTGSALGSALGAKKSRDYKFQGAGKDKELGGGYERQISPSKKSEKISQVMDSISSSVDSTAADTNGREDTLSQRLFSKYGKNYAF
jgi:hypothetical protein